VVLLVLTFAVTPVTTTETTTTTTSIINTKIEKETDELPSQHDNLRRVGPVPNSTKTTSVLLPAVKEADNNVNILSSDEHPHLRSTTTQQLLENESFHNDVISSRRQLQNTCGIPCTTDVQCCSNSGGCNCCKITNSISGTGICTNEFGCGRDSQCWDGPNTCVDNYVELQSGLKLINPGQTLKLCANSLIQIRQTLICHKSHINIQCESGNNCRIQQLGSGRIMTFSGTDITLQQITFIGGNTSVQGGGGLYVQGSANIVNSRFENNQVTSQGGRGGAANVGSGSSRPTFTGSSNTAVAGCHGIFVRPNGPCYGTPVATQDRFNNPNQGGGNTQCGSTCFSNGNCNRQGLEGYCRMCDLEQSSATFGKCVTDPNEDPRTLDQCSKPCSVDGDCLTQVGPCKTCEGGKCIDDTQRSIVPSSRSCVMNQGMLRTALTSPNTEQVVEICANTNIVLTSEIVVTQPNKILRCQGDMGQNCIISRERGSSSSNNKHRLLSVSGNNFTMRHLTLQGGDVFSTGGAGGALNFLGDVTKLEISHCNFIGNIATTGGAIALGSLSSTTILQSNFGAGNGGGGCMNIVVKSTGQCLNF
jgi:hypothetical protein